MRFDIAEQNRQTLSVTASGALDMGYSLEAVAAGLKRAATAQIVHVMNGYRDRVASACAGKLIAYQFKAQIAEAPDDATGDDLALIDREATARGMTRQDHLSLINAKHAAYRKVALLIEALEAEAKATISAVPDDAGIEAQVSAALTAARTAAQAEFETAFSALEAVA